MPDHGYPILNTPEKSKETWLVENAIGPFVDLEAPRWQDIPDDCCAIVWSPNVCTWNPYDSIASILITRSSFYARRDHLWGPAKLYIARLADIQLVVPQAIEHRQHLITLLLQLGEVLEQKEKAKHDKAGLGNTDT